MTTRDQFLVSVIADYGHLSDLAFAEVTQTLMEQCEDLWPTIKPYSVPAFDTVATGFMLAQTALNSKLGAKHMFFVNTAPRKDDLKPREANAGEAFTYVKLTNDIEICAVNSGYSLSFIKDHAEEIRTINCENAGSQFRSRDKYPPAFGKIAHGDHSDLGDDVTSHIPDAPQDCVMYTDGYGNMKCTLDHEALEPLIDKTIELRVGATHNIVKVCKGMFSVEEGQLILSHKGSSGWARPDGHFKAFPELVVRGGSAASRLHAPQGGTKITWNTL